MATMYCNAAMQPIVGQQHNNKPYAQTFFAQEMVDQHGVSFALISMMDGKGASRLIWGGGAGFISLFILSKIVARSLSSFASRSTVDGSHFPTMHIFGKR